MVLAFVFVPSFFVVAVFAYLSLCVGGVTELLDLLLVSEKLLVELSVKSGTCSDAFVAAYLNLSQGITKCPDGASVIGSNLVPGDHSILYPPRPGNAIIFSFCVGWSLNPCLALIDCLG